MSLEKKIAVMLSSYNGEKYIEEQIESILSQEKVKVYLYIRDDGSTDGTKKILEKYTDNTNIIIEFGENLGFQRSFMQIVGKIQNQYDYYAFADQDDYWKKEKLLEAVKILEKNRGTELYTSALDVVDEFLQHQYYNEFSKLRKSFGSAISRQRLAGCTMVFTPKILEMTKEFPIDEYYTIFSHDAIVYYLTLLSGNNVYFDKKSFISFRRHKGTITEHGKGFIKRVKSVTNIFSENKAWKYHQINVLYNYYNENMTTEIKAYCMRVLNYKENFINTIRFAMDKRVRCGIFSVDFINIIAIILHCY